MNEFFQIDFERYKLTKNKSCFFFVMKEFSVHFRTFRSVFALYVIIFFQILYLFLNPSVRL